MAHNHLVVEDATFSLTTIDDHGLLINGCTVVLAGSGRVTGRFALDHASLVSVEFEQLISALADLAFGVEFETAAKGVDFAVKSHRGMTLSALDDLSAGVRDALPDNLVTDGFGTDDLFADVVIQTTN